MGNFEGMKLEEMYKLLDEHYRFKPDSGYVSIYKRKTRKKNNQRDLLNSKITQQTQGKITFTKISVLFLFLLVNDQMIFFNITKLLFCFKEWREFR